MLRPILSCSVMRECALEIKSLIVNDTFSVIFRHILKHDVSKEWSLKLKVLYIHTIFCTGAEFQFLMVCIMNLF